jgi:two-component system NtrC family sensor kinase
LFDDLKKAHEELKSRQNQLIQSEKLSAMGRLAGGVAHEIINPLTSILGFADLISAQLNLSASDQENMNKCIDYLMILKNEATRCKQITQGLLQLAHPQKGEKTSTDINMVVNESLKIAQFHLKSHNINLITDFQPDLPPIIADKNQLQQVFLNLVINAKDALDRGGTIRIKTQVKAQWVVIRFEDNGCGMPAEDLEKAFLPLYTTKQEGKGSGLGLSISQSIIEDHRGFIEAKSRPGKGTTFVIRFPSAPAG